MREITSFFEQNVFLISTLSLAISSCLYIAHFLLFRYSFPLITPDDASFLSPAYDLIYKGKFSTSIHSQFLPGAAEYTYWMPPLYMVMLAAYLKLIGCSFVKAKLFSFICFLLSGLLVSALTKNKITRIWILAIWLCCPFVLIASSTIRMEVAGVLFTCITLFALRKNYNVIVLGVLAGASLMTHPLYFVCGASIGIVILARSDWRQLAVFTTVLLLTISPYLWYISLEFDLFQEQMQLQLERKASKLIFSIEPPYLLQFLPLSLLSFLLLIKLKISSELKLFILSGLILTNLLILKSQEFNYQLATIPYALAGIILYVNEQNKKLPTFFGFMLLYLFFIGILFQKGKKINFTDDDTINELVGAMHSNRRLWENKTIFVAGSTDLSGFLLLDGQRVERINGVYKLPNPRWHERYDLVISLVNAVVPEDDQADAFWLRWPKVSSYQTRSQQFTLSMYKKPDLGSLGYSKQDSSYNAAEVRRISTRRISEPTE